ncbi:MAG TPA: CBS domain-containing protein [Acidimicrobiia bacterium]|nr:CBS domain-containing protein [Acidimicrobiia bacterium]
MLVREAMGGPVDTCSADTTISQVAKRMTEQDHGAMPVTQNGRLIGIITERDILRSVGLGENSALMKVKYLMTPDPDYLEPDVSIEDAADWMLAAGYRHLPVVEDDEILGILSVKDVLWALTGGIVGAGAWSRNDDKG